MSWISEFAGKAEHFLNKIDQNAAVALNSQTVDSDGRSRSKPKTLTAVAPGVNEGRQTGKYSTAGSNFPSSTESTFEPKRENNELSTGVNDSTNASATASTSHSKSLIVAPNKVKPPRKTTNISPRQNNALESASGNGQLQHKSSKTTDQELLDFLNSPDQKEIDVNSLLKTELDTQKREMSLLLRNNKKLQQDYETLKNSRDLDVSLPQNGNSLMESDSESPSEIRKFLENQIAIKDAEIDRLMERLDQALEKLEHTGELQSGQNRIQVLERENRQLSTQCEELTNSVETSAAQIALTEKQTKSLKETLSSLEKEFSSYKDKAKIILKSKDDLISYIKSHSGNENEDEEQSTDVNLVTAEAQFLSEIGALRNERELLHAEITQSRVYMDSIREESNRIEEELQTLRSANANLHKLLSKEKQKCDGTQEENLQLSQEISNLQLLLERERIEGRKTQEKLEKFCDQNSNSMTGSLVAGAGGVSKSSSLSDFANANVGGGRFSTVQTSSGYSDMDETENLRTRITALSQSLLEKQNLINSLSSDKQVLQIRCERLNGQLEGFTSSTDSLGNENNITHSVVSSQPLYLSESPWDSRMATRVKRAYSKVDSFCCEIGLVLRQRPNLRLGFCIYIICLHLWVFLILFTWAHHTSVSGHPENLDEAKK